MTHNLLLLGVPFALGVGLGMFYFGGLWMTVQRLPATPRPAALAFGSFWLRSAACGWGFYWAMDGQWERLIICLLGFLGIRSVLIRRWGPPAPQPPAPQKG